MSPLSRTIRDRRRRLGWSLSRLARAAECSKAYLSGIENGRFENPPARPLVRRLETALATRPGELTRLADWQATPPAVRAAYDRLADTLRRQRDPQTAPHTPGVNLDAMFRSGELQRTAEHASGNLEPVDTPPPDTAASRDHENARAFPPSRSSLLQPPQPGPPRNDDPAGPGGPAPPLPRVPLINRVAAGYPADFTDLGYPARIADEYVPCPGPPAPDAFAARVVGDSMQPDYQPGDVLVFDPGREPTHGADCFARLLPDHQSTFKRAFFEPDGRIRLQPLNPAFPPRIEPPEHIAGLYPAIYRVQTI